MMMLGDRPSAGTIEYEDTGGSGPVVVLLHGLAMDGSLFEAFDNFPPGLPGRAVSLAGRLPCGSTPWSSLSVPSAS
jgi:pimeloyl-ACP methyl ester carboxylesterase